MRWPWSRRPKPKPRLVDPFIDMERDSIPLNNDDDSMSLMFELALRGQVVTVAMDSETSDWVVVVGERVWARPTQVEALLAARDELRAEP